MSKRISVTLPSGRSVLLTRVSDPKRPWGVSESAGMYYLSRARLGDSSSEERFASDQLSPLLFDKPDAEALKVALDRHRSGRTPFVP